MPSTTDAEDITAARGEAAADRQTVEPPAGDILLV